MDALKVVLIILCGWFALAMLFKKLGLFQGDEEKYKQYNDDIKRRNRRP
jgi:hypothetical protein